MARLRGRVVVVGLVKMEIDRSLYYRKELDLRMSMSYGPGRYDPDFEERGFDYPLAHVRWTEQRNLEAFLELVADGRLRLGPLVTHRYEIDHALDGTRRGSVVAARHHHEQAQADQCTQHFAYRIASDALFYRSRQPASEPCAV